MTDISDNGPDISEVLKALNHPLRREILLFLSERHEGSFTQLHNHVRDRTKSTGQFSYHLKLLLDAKIIEKASDSYNLSPIGEKASAMIQLIDLEVDRSIVQHISSSYSQLSPTDMVLIAWMITPLIFIAVIVSDYTNLALSPFTYIILLISSVLILLFATIFTYSKLQYLPSLFFLTNLLWIFFLPKDQLKIGLIYFMSGAGIGFLFTGILTESNILMVVLGGLLLVSAIFLSIMYIRSESKQFIDIRIK